MKKIEDYLHLYLGCKVELDNGGSKVYNRKLIAVGGVDDEPYCKLRLGDAGEGQFVHAVLLKENRAKPILRPLSSMTEEEREEAATTATIHGAHITITTHYEGMRYLLSKHFDLFGLIDAGLAIDSTTL